MLFFVDLQVQRQILQHPLYLELNACAMTKLSALGMHTRGTGTAHLVCMGAGRAGWLSDARMPASSASRSARRAAASDATTAFWDAISARRLPASEASMILQEADILNARPETHDRDMVHTMCPPPYPCPCNMCNRLGKDVPRGPDGSRRRRTPRTPLSITERVWGLNTGDSHAKCG